MPKLKNQGCNRPPRGWWCNLVPNHDGPCPARPKWWNQSSFGHPDRQWQRNLSSWYWSLRR